MHDDVDEAEAAYIASLLQGLADSGVQVRTAAEVATSRLQTFLGGVEFTGGPKGVAMARFKGRLAASVILSNVWDVTNSRLNVTATDSDPLFPADVVSNTLIDTITEPATGAVVSIAAGSNWNIGLLIHSNNNVSASVDLAFGVSDDVGSSNEGDFLTAVTDAAAASGNSIAHAEWTDVAQRFIMTQYWTSGLAIFVTQSGLEAGKIVTIKSIPSVVRE